VDFDLVFVDTYLKEPWYFNFYLNSEFLENEEQIKEYDIADDEMSNSLLEKIKLLPHNKYISKRRGKDLDGNLELKDNFFRCFKFFFEKNFFEIYKNNILSQTMNNNTSSKIKFYIINIDLIKSSGENLLCEDCQCTCFKNYNGICLFCSNNCKASRLVISQMFLFIFSAPSNK